MRATLSVVVGYAAWTAVWLAGNAVLGRLFPSQLEAFEGDGMITSAAYLLAALVLSATCSLIAGWLNAKLVARQSEWPLWTMIALLIATGVAVQWSTWRQLPVWYHLAFLILLAPMCHLGGRVGRG